MSANLTVDATLRYPTTDSQRADAEEVASAVARLERAVFDLFGDFRGYVDHFLLNDLVAVNYASVKFLTAFDDFAGDPLPAANVAEYQQYMIRSMDFISARNERIAHFASSELHDRT